MGSIWEKTSDRFGLPLVHLDLMITYIKRGTNYKWNYLLILL